MSLVLWFLKVYRGVVCTRKASGPESAGIMFHPINHVTDRACELVEYE